MLAGAAANFMKTTISALVASPGVRDTRILPVDLDGPAPEAGTPNFFVRTVDDQQDVGDPTDRIEVWTAATNWAIPNLRSRYTTSLARSWCATERQWHTWCIPQPSLPIRLMRCQPPSAGQIPQLRLAYRLQPDHQCRRRHFCVAPPPVLELPASRYELKEHEPADTARGTSAATDFCG
jgi:hypothetical protein